MTHPPRPPAHAQPGSTRTFREKLGIYLVGITIGFVILGWFQLKKRQAARSAAPVPTQTEPAQDTPGESGASPESVPAETGGDASGGAVPPNETPPAGEPG